MKLQRDKLRQYQKRITVLTDKETAMAKQMLAAGNKSGALLALRRKKYQETLLSKTDSQLAQLEQLTSNVEFALIQMKSETLNRVNEALGRLEAGSYGFCYECGDEISEARLRALPFALRCKDCEEEREQAEARDKFYARRSTPAAILDIAS